MTASPSLKGLKLGLIRPRPLSGDRWVHSLEEAGASVSDVHLTERIERTDLPERLSAIDDLLAQSSPSPRCWMLSVASPYAAELILRYRDAWVLGAHRVIVTGARTEKALERFLDLESAVILADPPNSVGLARCLWANRHSDDDLILMLGAQGGRTEGWQWLQTKTPNVHRVELYKTVPMTPLPQLPHVDWWVFTSPSSVRAFAGHPKEDHTKAKLAVIGSTTAQSVEEWLKRKPDAEAMKPTVESVVQSICQSL